MAKYIDAEKLKVRIAQIQKEHPYNPYSENYESGCHEGYLGCCDELLSLIDSLQQEQTEVDLEKEIKNERSILLDLFGPMNGEQSLAISNLARHFYELGKNSK